MLGHIRQNLIITIYFEKQQTQQQLTSKVMRRNEKPVSIVLEKLNK
jgi:hypothetical protein